MALHREVDALLELARVVLADLERPLPDLATRLAAWEQTAHQARELANRVVLGAAAAAKGDPAAAERHRLVAELAVWLAVNAEWAVAMCQPHRSAPADPSPGAASGAGQTPVQQETRMAWLAARDALTHTALGVVRMLTASHSIPPS